MGEDTEPDYTLELRKRAEGWSVVRERIRAGTSWIEVNEQSDFKHPTEGGQWVSYTAPMRATLRFQIHRYLTDAEARPVIEPIVACAARLAETQRYRPSALDIASNVPIPGVGQSSIVRENGRGVALEILDLDRAPLDEITTAVRGEFDHVEEISVKRGHQGVRLRFRTRRSDERLPAPQESDGVLLSTFLHWTLRAAQTTDPVTRVCLERA